MELGPRRMYRSHSQSRITATRKIRVFLLPKQQAERDAAAAKKDADAKAAAKKAAEQDICIPIGEGENCW